MNIKAIVFDYGQVISLPQDQKMMEEIVRRIGVESEEFKSVLWTLRGDYDRGIISARDYFKKVLSHFDVYLNDKSIDELVELDSMSWKNVNPETVLLMEEIKKAGYLLGILSNMPQNFLSWARENISAFSLPHVSVFSCEVKLIKPEEAIYRKLLSLLSVEAEELVFFDDKINNIEGARVLGIEAVLWEGPENARRELLSLGAKL